MRLVLTLLAIVTLAACSDVTPDDGAVVERMQVNDEVPLEDSEKTTEKDTEEEDAEKTTEQQEAKIVVINNDNPEISDTQDFGALTERVTIEDDKALLKAQRDKFKVIAPTALPSRKGNAANVVEYALKSTNKVGEKVYSRGNPLGKTLAKRNCKQYRLPDDAQAAFLKAGGPKRDNKNLDPDGDGFACAWTPDTYRKLLQ
jgi:hypothetical protein